MEQFSKTLTSTFFLVVTALIFFTLDRLGTLTNFHKVVGAPLEFSQIPVFILKNNLLSKAEFLIKLSKIEEENVALSEKLAKVTAENANLAQLVFENQALRAQLDLVYSSQLQNRPKFIAAKVLGSARNLVIEPENPGLVKTGDVVTFGNNFVGQVSQTGIKLAKVRSISDPASLVPAKVLTLRGQIFGNLVGRFGKNLVLEKVEKQEIVPVDTIVQTVGGEDIAEGLVLGKVTRVFSTSSSPFQEIEVESLVDFSKLTTVFILSD